MKLVFATNNSHKLQECRSILPSEVELISLNQLGFAQEIAETGATLEENSLLKAKTVYDWILRGESSIPLTDITGVFADDTGLEIAALGGAPGVLTARWAGEPPCDGENRRKALMALQYEENRSARFRTVITLIRDGSVERVEGVVQGKIASEEQGINGFGYDSIFIPNDYHQTFAELSATIKNTISHRARAMRALCQIL